MTDDEALEVLQNKNARIEWLNDGYKLIVCHGPIPLEQLHRLLATSTFKPACNGAPIWWLRTEEKSA